MSDWITFERTGSVYDYMRYKNLVKENKNSKDMSQKDEQGK